MSADAPDELVEAVARALAHIDAEGDVWHSLYDEGRDEYRAEARAVLSVPALAEVIARDAKVREIVAADPPATVQPHGFFGPMPFGSYERIAALYPEAGK